MPSRYFINKFAPKGQPSRDPSYWKERIRQIVDIILNNEQSIIKDCDGGLYVGPGGVGYALYYLGKSLDNKELLEKAEHFLSLNSQYYQMSRLKPGDKLGFLLGKAGIDAVNCVLSKEIGKNESTSLNEFKSCAKEFVTADPLGCGSDEMLVGRSGYILGALWMNQAFKTDCVDLKVLYQLCDVMLASGRNYALRSQSPSPLMYQYYRTEYLGAAHGLCGILQAVLSVPGYFLHNPGAEALVKSAVDFYVSLQTQDGNFPCAMDELASCARADEDQLVHWCHGAPGAVYLVARAYLTWKQDKYLQSALQAGECVWRKGLLKKGPGICHGVAGSGYVFLLLYRLTGDTNHLYRAEKFGEFLFCEEFSTGARIPDCPFSLYEGWAGTLCFLTDLMRPDQACFPFSDVFTI